jgi:hypothetical protein
MATVASLNDLAIGVLRNQRVVRHIRTVACCHDIPAGRRIVPQTPQDNIRATPEEREIDGC